MPVFLFTDIENSTRLWEDFRPFMFDVLQRHDAIVMDELVVHDGRIIKHTGDGIYAVFPEGGKALICAFLIQQQFLHTDWGQVKDVRVRIGLDARPPEREGKDYFTNGEDYFGPVINTASRIMNAGWGGQILFSPDVLQIARLPEKSTIHDFGEHRLKGIRQMQRIYGLEHPELAVHNNKPLRIQTPTATASAADITVPVQLPLRPPYFIGREAELGKLLDTLQPGNVVTLCGPGGIGKSSLVAEALWRLAPEGHAPERFPDGVVFHNFNDQPQMMLAFEEIIRAFAPAELPSDPRSAVRRVLSNKRALLVLDGAEDTDDLQSLLAVRGACGVLITSRRHQDAIAHWEDVTPLPLAEAAQLLQAWGQERAINETAVREICARVGGLPLAIQLIGRHLAQHQEDIVDYLAWLNDAPLSALDLGVHPSNSIPILLEKSLDQISATTRVMLGAVGLMALAPFDRSVLEVLGFAEREVRLALGELVNYGLLIRSGRKYQVSHALVHTYARQRLQIPPEISERLTAYYLNLVEQIEATNDEEGQEQFNTDRPHIMTTLNRLVAEEQWAKVRTISQVMGDYLDANGRLTEHATVVEAGLTSARALGYRQEEKSLVDKLLSTYGFLGLDGEIMAADQDVTVKVRGELIAGRYEVANMLTGGMANVYLCLDIETKELVALKTFKPHLLPNRTAREMFLQEGTTWVELGRHPYIVPAYRVVRIGHSREVYIVLEWVLQPLGQSKPSLRAILQPGSPLPYEQVVLTALHIARGMRYATSKIPGLIHRDLKPENILIDHSRNARVTDFGLAKVLSESKKKETNKVYSYDSLLHTQFADGVVGTPRYMAPEQWGHLPLDMRTDIYALGCIVYEMITGSFAVEGETTEQLREGHLLGRIRPLPAATPEAMTLFLQKSIARQPAQRFKDWAAVETALTNTYHWLTDRFPPAMKIATDNTYVQRIASGYSYNTLGMSYLDIGKLAVAVKYFEKAVWIARNENVLELEGVGLGNLGAAYMALGYGKRGIEFYQEHLSIARETKDLSQEGLALGNLGRAYCQLYDTRQAIACHERELHIAQEVIDKYREAAALDNLGDAYWREGNRVKALAYYQQALNLAYNINDKPRIKSVLRSLGQINLEDGDGETAESLFRRTLNISRQIGDRVGEGEAFGDFGHLYHQRGKHDRAIAFYQHALSITEESNDRWREGRYLTSLGDIYAELNVPEEAQFYYEAALKTVEETGDQARRIYVLDKLGDLQLAKGDPIEAAKFFKQLYLLAQETENENIIRRGLLRLGAAYERWGDIGRGIEYYNKYIKRLSAPKDWAEEKRIWMMLGRLHLKIKQGRPAYETFKAYFERARAMVDRQAEIEALVEMGEILRLTGNQKAAVSIYKEVLDLSHEVGDVAMEALTLGNMGLANFELGKRWQATRQLEKAFDLTKQTEDALLQAQISYKNAVIHCKQKRWSKALPLAQQAHDVFLQHKDEEMVQRTQKILDLIDSKKSTGFFS